MKNQYYGDINDYKKYSLIRHLTIEGEFQSSICWALTRDDGQSDGRKIGYLKNPMKWKKHDPLVFEQLRKEIIVEQERNVDNLKKNKLISNGKYFDRTLEDKIDKRNDFFKEFVEFSKDSDFIFFDPDNGIEVKSVPIGKTGSSKYIYWDEVISFFDMGKSLLIYQHFPRVERDRYTKKLTNRIFNSIDTDSVIVFITSHVLFLLIPQKKFEDYFNEKSECISEKWAQEIKVIKFHRRDFTSRFYSPMDSSNPS